MQSQSKPYVAIPMSVHVQLQQGLYGNILGFSKIKDIIDFEAHIISLSLNSI